MIVSFAMLSFASIFASAAEPQRPVTKKELKTLLKTASTPADHLRIAAYYRAEAQRLTARSQEHATEAASYEKYSPFPAMVERFGTGFGQGAPHCHYWSKQYAEDATKAEAQAALHEDLAKKVTIVAAAHDAR
jgi:hypothetical protein